MLSLSLSLSESKHSKYSKNSKSSILLKTFNGRNGNQSSLNGNKIECITFLLFNIRKSQELDSSSLYFLN